MAAEWIFVPVTLFLSIAAIAIAMAYFRLQRIRAEAQGGTDYRRLAEEATNNQRAVLDEVRKMNRTLEEIERVLKEVG